MLSLGGTSGGNEVKFREYELGFRKVEQKVYVHTRDIVSSRLGLLEGEDMLLKRATLAPRDSG